MTTNEFVSMMLEEVAAGWTRTRILEFTNRVQNEILGEDCELMRVKPDPFLLTVDSIYTYVASSRLYDSTTGAQGALAGDVRTVREVYSYSNDLTIFGTQTIDPESAKPNLTERTVGREKTIARVTCIDSIEPNSSDCVLKWWEANNPGATTITWRARAFKWPTQLTAETVALSIPADFQHTLLYYGVLRFVERREYGRGDYPFAAYEKELKKFRTRYNLAINQDMRGICVPRVV